MAMRKQTELSYYIRPYCMRNVELGKVPDDSVLKLYSDMEADFLVMIAVLAGVIQ